MKTKSLKKYLQCGAALAAALALLPLNSAKATLIWSADTSRGTANFETLDIDETGGTIKVVNDPLGQQGSVFQYFVPNEPTGFGKTRTESKGTVTPSGNYQLNNNTDYYVGWRAMWNPMPIDPGWVALFQLHGYGPSGQPAPLVIRCINGDGNISMQNGVTGGNSDFWHVPFKAGVWQTFVVHVNISASASTGYVELWYNGVNQTLAGGVNVNGNSRLYCQTLDPTSGSFDALKWGCYRSGAMDGAGSADAYMVNAKLGTTFADVDPGGGGTQDFSLSASPGSVTVNQGSSGTSTISVSDIGGFTGSVSLSASGLPSGVTASFNPSSTTSSSTLTLTASSTATTGTSTVTIKGTSGSLTHTTTVNLTVNSSGGGNFSGVFQIQNEASSKVLNSQGLTTNGSPITQWPPQSSTNLDWTFIATSNGYYQINSSKSGLDAVVKSASTADGAGIIQWSFGSSGDDQWLPQANSDGSYTFVNLHSGLVLEDPASSTNNTTQMDQNASNGGSNQKWMLLKQ